VTVTAPEEHAALHVRLRRVAVCSEALVRASGPGYVYTLTVPHLCWVALHGIFCQAGRSFSMKLYGTLL